MRILLLCALLCGASLAAQTPALSAEATAFLEQLPANLQERQATAIRQALAGQPDALRAERSARLRAAHPTPSDATLAVRDERLAGGLRLRFYEPTGATPSTTVLYLHGGGWVLGSVDSCDAFCAALARQAHVRVVSVDYRLAPEHPFPAAREDALAAVAHLRARHTGALILAGDSAGGNLALTAADACRPDGLLLFYPVVDATMDNRPSWQRYGKGYGLDANLMEAFNDAYAPAPLRRASPHLSPLRALDALPRLPPTLLIAAECDILADQGKAFVETLQAKGHPIRRTVIPGSVHLFITVPGQPKARAKALKASTHFLRSFLNPPSASNSDRNPT